MTGTIAQPLTRTGGDWQIPVLVQILYIIAPIQFLSVYVGGIQMTAGMVLCAMVGAIGIVLFVSSDLALYWNQDRPIIYGLAFVCVCAVGIANTPYGAPAASKGLINLVAIILMLGMVLVIVRTAANYAGLFQHLVRISVYVTGVIAVLGVFQSFVSNFLGVPELFDLSGLSGIAGANWWSPAIESGITRAQSVYAEPSVLAGYIGFTTGIAYLRLGLFGKAKRDALREVMPLWAAWGIVLCMILTLSPVCFASMIFTAVGVAISSMKVRLKTVLFVLLFMAVTLAICVSIVLALGGSILDRFTGMVIFTQLSGQADFALATKGGLNVSTITLFLNSVVTMKNVIAHPLLGVGMGGHPFAYDAFMPSFSNFGEAVVSGGKIVTLNKADAASLFLRLMSETGILGTLAFFVMSFSVFLRARRCVLEGMAARRETTDFLAISIGLNGAMLGVFAAHMFRISVYYNPPFWTLFALCVAIPVVSGMPRRVPAIGPPIPAP